MALRELRVSGYRSLRDLRLPVTGLDVFVGPNGSGKSNLYRALVLLAASASGSLARMVAEEGGMPSALWAGKARPSKPVRVTLGAALDEYDYEIAFGLPPMDNETRIATAFGMDPLVKEESVRADLPQRRRKVALLERQNETAWLRDADGHRVSYPTELLSSEGALSQIRESHLYPELSHLREEMLAWRFYHHFRTDPDSPLRRPQTGVQTAAMSSSGDDLAAALQTIIEVGDGQRLEEVIDEAFPGATLEIFWERGRFEVGLTMPGIGRPFEARELSDGTLRYLCLVAALLSARPPAFLVLNEPETSIHADLIEPLAKLIAGASEVSQIWVITHSEALADRIAAETGRRPLRLEKVDAATRIAGQRLDGSVEEDLD